MKKILIAAIALFLFLPIVSAQTNTEEIDFFQSIFGEEKKAIVASFVELEGEAKDAFWTLYDDYELQRKELGKSRISLLDKYVETYEGISDTAADEMIAAISKQAKSLDKLINSYYKKIRKASGSKSAAQFYHLEHYFLSAIRLSILESLPVIGELDD
jgi:hypothetical protein